MPQDAPQSTAPPADIRVLVVDDTVTYRAILSRVVESLPEVTLVGTAANGRLAINKLEENNNVDLMLLDVEMPELNGVETLAIVKQRFPHVGVIMVSGVNASSAAITIQALESGALDFIAKPSGGDMEENRLELRKKLVQAIRPLQIQRNLERMAHLQKSRPVEAPTAAAPPIAPPPPKATFTKAAPAVPKPQPVETSPPSSPPLRAVGAKPTPSDPGQVRAVVTPPPSRFDVLAIGVSTGGPNALTEVIPHLPGDLGIPILMVQHMPPFFTASLAESLNKKSALTVKEAQEGEPVLPNTVYIAPGGKHMVVQRRRNAGGPSDVFIALNEDPPENSCRPAVDVLFRSVGTVYEKNILAVIMTGMGSDGAKGVQALKARGERSCYCLTQSADTCVVYGMPRAVDEAGLSDESIPLAKMAKYITTLAYNVWRRP